MKSINYDYLVALLTLIIYSNGLIKYINEAQDGIASTIC